MPSVLAETPRKMLPPPITMPTSTPISTTSRTSCAICCSVLGEMPYFPSPISASPLSFSRMRLNRGGLAAGTGTGGGSYLALWRGSRTDVPPFPGRAWPPKASGLVGVLGQRQRRIRRLQRTRRDVHLRQRLQLLVHRRRLVAKPARSGDDHALERADRLVVGADRAGEAAAQPGE